ncbi:WecB/TagA/CpsF family glycosyltransferase [Leptospira sp. GIMC2001]|uniref:WecB/TagA/CpsF family glycosyltransferase n=1 Tax=Leptospira sp. GIMC2001 TaxID=1513297 RepID=UPI00234AD0B9|nr:WecB/TagA/CpsF family glycosyltransferase [Leptospira sp. GIMC2001]WCL48535.1 WecB/TagA/CpsF family glycosyltransferase [Leptospira sp. GIMC2001]
MNSPESITHHSSKEERDYLLEYQSIDISNIQKIDILGIQFDNATMDEAIAKIAYWIDKKDRFHHVLFMDPPRLMKLRSGKKLHRITSKADMILAEGAGLGWASNGQLKARIPVIALLMDLVRLAELKGYTIFMLGAKEEVIERVFFNLTRHFPKLRIVGRHAGHMNRHRELMVKEAIRKTSPNIILFANDFPEQEIWIENNTGFFGNSVVIGVSGAFDILSGKDRKAPDFFKLKGYTWLWRIIARPYRIFRMFRIAQFIIFVLISKILKKKSNSN